MSLNATSGVAFGDASDPSIELATASAKQAAERSARAAADVAIATHACDPPGQLFPFVSVTVSEHVVVNQLRDKHVRSAAPLQYSVIAAAAWTVHFACIELPTLKLTHATHDVSTHTQKMPHM
jgi:hypothetical protein